MLAANQVDRGDFWELMHAALGLQHQAACLAEQGQPEDAAYYERQAIAILLDATCMLDPHEPALVTVRQLATAGLARLHGLKKAVRAIERGRTAPTGRPQSLKKPAPPRRARVRAARG
jgi:hypothetical protein